MCEYCRECGERKLISERELSHIDRNTYTGLQMEVEPVNEILDIFCVLENKNIRPISKVFKVPIKFCPMCGRKLED